MAHKNKQHLILFARAPEPGKCKTRLIPLLGKNGAAELHRKLITHCLQQIATLEDTDISLYIDEQPEHLFFREIQQQHPVTVKQQQGFDLGERMYIAMRDSLKSYDKCVLIGSDCPEMNADYINQAFTKLDDHDQVLGPASDGGYVLIGLQKINRMLFQNVNWSHETVLQQSLYNSEQTGYRHTLLTTLWDIDEPRDYIQHHKRIWQLLNTHRTNGDYYGPPTGRQDTQSGKRQLQQGRRSQQSG